MTRHTQTPPTRTRTHEGARSPSARTGISPTTCWHVSHVRSGVVHALIGNVNADDHVIACTGKPTAGMYVPATGHAVDCPRCVRIVPFDVR